VVQGGINAVDANSVDTQLLKEWYITLAGSTKRERVDEARRLAESVVVGGNNNTLLLVCNTLDVEPGSRLVVKVFACASDFREALDTRDHKASEESKEHWGSNRPEHYGRSEVVGAKERVGLYTWAKN